MGRDLGAVTDPSNERSVDVSTLGDGMEMGRAMGQEY